MCLRFIVTNVTYMSPIARRDIMGKNYISKNKFGSFQIRKYMLGKTEITK